MEAIGAASAIAGLVSLSGGVLAKAAALNSVLDQLQSLVEQEQHDSLEQDMDTEIRRPGLKHMVDNGNQGQELRNLGKRVIWPFKEKETKEALARLGRVRGHLTAALTADMASNLTSIYRVAHETAVGVVGLGERMARRDQAEEHRALVAWLDPQSINMK
ncbi:hypothetical protein LA080_002804 [Diaporthe eres]|nr:hypothetical protein LA080_002804 [Diaporthe eres]